MLQQRAVAGQRQELLGPLLPAARPEPRAAAAGHDHRVKHAVPSCDFVPTAATTDIRSATLAATRSFITRSTSARQSRIPRSTLRGQFLRVEREQRADLQRHRRVAVRPSRHLDAGRSSQSAARSLIACSHRLRRVGAGRVLQRRELLAPARLHHRPALGQRQHVEDEQLELQGVLLLRLHQLALRRRGTAPSCGRGGTASVPRPAVMRARKSTSKMWIAGLPAQRRSRPLLVGLPGQRPPAGRSTRSSCSGRRPGRGCRACRSGPAWARPSTTPRPACAR